MGEAIVVGTDGSETAKRAVAEAVRLAKALDGEIHVVSAYEPLRGTRIGGGGGAPGEASAPLPDAKVEATVEDAEASVRYAGVPVHSHACRESPAEALLQVADEVGAAMIVVGSRGMHGAKRYVLGSVPNTVSHRARCNVLIVATDAAG